MRLIKQTAHLCSTRILQLSMKIITRKKKMQHKLITTITQEERERWRHKHKGGTNFTALNNEIQHILKCISI